MEWGAFVTEVVKGASAVAGAQIGVQSQRLTLDERKAELAALQARTAGSAAPVVALEAPQKDNTTTYVAGGVGLAIAATLAFLVVRK